MDLRTTIISLIKSNIVLPGEQRGRECSLRITLRCCTSQRQTKLNYIFNGYILNSPVENHIGQVKRSRQWKRGGRNASRYTPS